MNKELIHIIERIKEIKQLQSKAAVAEAIGISKENLNGYLKRNKIPLEAVLLFCEKENISPTYLLYGTEKIPAREKIRLKYRMELPAVTEDPSVYTTTEEKNAEVFAQVRAILNSRDDFVIKALRERLRDYQVTVAMNAERRTQNQRLDRVEEMLRIITDEMKKPGGRLPPGGTEAAPAEDATERTKDTEEKAM